MSGDDPGMEGSKKRASVSTDGDQLQKAARIEVLGATSRLENMPVLRREIGEDKEIGVDRLVHALELKDGVVLPLVWKSPDALTYVQLGVKDLDVRRFGVLPSPGRVHGTMH